MAIFTTALVPLFLKWGTEWLQRHNQLVRSRDERKGVVLVGASATARLLAKGLSEAGPVTLIDKNRYHCSRADDEGLSTICGDALDVEVLSQAGLGTARTFLALTPNSEVNVLAGRLAREQFSVPEVNVLVPEGDASLRTLADETGIRPVEDWMNIEQWDHWIGERQVEEITLEVPGQDELDNLLLDIRSGKEALPLLVVRNGERLPLSTVERMQQGDKVLAIQRKKG
jgi:hypothetical protein